MESSVHRFARFLRLAGVRIGVSEVVDGMRALAVPGIAADRDLTRAALRVSLIKDRRDEPTFDRLFELFFRLRPVVDDDEDGHSHAHDDLSDEAGLEKFSLSEEPGDTPQEGHSHGKPADIKEFFDDEDMAQQYNLHQEANRLDMASMTDEIVLSDEASTDAERAARVQLTTSRLHNPGKPGEIATRDGMELDVELSVAEEMALLSWLDDGEESTSDEDLDTDELAALRGRLSGLLDGLPDALKRHLERLMAGTPDVESPDLAPPTSRTRVDEHERAELEEAVRRLLHSLHGAPRPRRREAARGEIDGARTMRRNMRFDGVPFRPVTVARVSDRPRLLLLVDVSLSVRTTARFTLQLVHGLQSMASKVRSFAFVSDLVEITDLFDEHPLDDALGLVMAGLPAGGVLDVDVDADSDYGNALGEFLEDHGDAITRRTTVIVLGDGRGNGKDPNFAALGEIARRARELVWLTPEPRYSWRLGNCDLPGYAASCDRLHVVRDLAGLDRVSGVATAAAASGSRNAS